MSAHADEGLLGSVLIYLTALLAGLALFVGPVLWANGPTVAENIAPSNGRALSASHHSDSNFPVAKLKHNESVSPAHLVELNARLRKTQNSRQPRHAVGRARHPQEVRHAQFSQSRATPPQRRYHRSSGALSAQY